jgi:lipoate-protein ligase A
LRRDNGRTEKLETHDAQTGYPILISTDFGNRRMTEQQPKRKWRLLSVPPRSGAENMARDVVLMNRARKTGEIIFSVYGWSEPTLSLGRNQRAKGCYDLDRMRAMGVSVVRRPTGGRALLHHREVTYSVTAPLDEGNGLRDSYERINRILLSGLQQLGVHASVADPKGPAALPNDVPCFATPARGELVSDGRKLVGSAQWRDDNVLLQHGSILIEDDQSLIQAFSVASDDRDPVPIPATLTSALGRAPEISELSNALFQAVR